MKKKIVVSGSSGFVGSKLVNKLIENGHEVIGIDKVKNPAANFETHIIDLKDPLVNELIPNNSHVFHLGAMSTDGECKANPVGAIEANILGTTNLVNILNSKQGISMSFASSEWVYPEKVSDDVDSEDDELSLQNLNSLYAMTKLFDESLIRSVAKFPYSIFRFGIIYGLRKNPGSALEKIVETVIKSDVISVGSGKTSRRYIHVDDLIKGLLNYEKCLDASNFDIYNITGDELISLKDIINCTLELSKKNISVLDEEKIPSIRNPLNTKFKNVVGWEPEIALKQGIRQIMDEFYSA
jgi:nucleoside-diphosphate-sugar epimerase